MNSLKLAALVAVGEDIFQPTISYTALLWAQNIVVYSVEKIIEMFEEDRIGDEQEVTNKETGVSERERYVCEVITKCLDKGYNELDRKLSAKGFVNRASILQQCRLRSCFKKEGEKWIKTMDIEKDVDNIMLSLLERNLIINVMNNDKNLNQVMTPMDKTKIYSVKQLEKIKTNVKTQLI